MGAGGIERSYAVIKFFVVIEVFDFSIDNETGLSIKSVNFQVLG